MIDPKEERLDRSVFKQQTVAEASDTLAYWLRQPVAFRIKCAYHLSLRAYGYDPANEPRLDRTVFSTRKHALKLKKPLDVSGFDKTELNPIT